MRPANGTIGFFATAIVSLLATTLIVGANPAAGHTGHERQTVTTEKTRPPGDLVANDPAPEVGILTADKFVQPVARPGDLKTLSRGDDWKAEPLGNPDGLTIGGQAGGPANDCFVDFNDDSVLGILPNNAIDTFVYWPFWVQSCSAANEAITIEPIGAESHYHLGYEDPDISWCNDLGTFGRMQDPADPLTDCDPIDPVTEPRNGLHTHYVNWGVRVLAHESVPGPDPRLQFDMNQIRVLSGEVEVCFVRTDLPWITSEATDQASGYCGHLTPGSWDVSASVTDAYEVRIWARMPNTVITDIGITTL